MDICLFPYGLIVSEDPDEVVGDLECVQGGGGVSRFKSGFGESGEGGGAEGYEGNNGCGMPCGAGLVV